LYVLPGRCTGCTECLEICPAGVISLAGEDLISVSDGAWKQ
jgi:Fe-S-cluster-containing hydrogenase component 2